MIRVGYIVSPVKSVSCLFLYQQSVLLKSSKAITTANFSSHHSAESRKCFYKSNLSQSLIPFRGSSLNCYCNNPFGLITKRDFHAIASSTITEKQKALSSLPVNLGKMTVTPTDNQANFSTDIKDRSVPQETNQIPDARDKKGRFKALIRDYGVTAVVFHVTISLASLGICWLLVNSSLPMEKIFIWLGIDKKLGNLTDAASTSTNFVVAYALHKSFALIRLSITAACVPVIVRYLRSKGVLKPVANVVKKAN